MKTKWLLMVALIIAGASLGPFLVYSQSETGGTSEEIEELNQQIAARKDKIKQLEDSIAKYQKNIEQKQSETVSLKNQLSILDNRTAQVTADIELTQERIRQTELEIEALDLSIKEKESVIDKQKAIIIKLVQNIQAEDQKNYLEIMLTNSSFADFYDQLRYLENVYTDLGRSVKTLRLAKEELSDKKSQADAKRITYNNLKEQLVQKRQDLAEQSVVKQNLLVQTHSSELRYRTLLTSLKAQYQQIEGEVRSYEDQVRKKLEEQQKISEGGDDLLMSWPVPSHYITASFHDATYPFRGVFEHSGIDLRASHGTAVKAAAAGYVARAKRCTSASCYSYVLLVHNGELSSLYGHLSSIAVNEDDYVARGDVIGYSGGTPGTVGAGPFVTGPHLHFETRLNGIPVDPLNYLMQ